jgi:hypothetical protein
MVKKCVSLALWGKLPFLAVAVKELTKVQNSSHFL